MLPKASKTGHINAGNLGPSGTIYEESNEYRKSSGMHGSYY